MTDTSGPRVHSLSTLHDLVRGRADRQAGQPAVLAPGRTACSYARLAERVDACAETLRRLGVGSGDVVALSIPNGAPTAVCFLGTAAVATCAPLNPSYTSAEAAFYLDDLAPRALIVPADEPGAAADAARARGIIVVGLVVEDGPAGTFRLELLEHGSAGSRASRASDLALILHTSGTTSRPKQVPLTHANLLSSAAHVAAALELTPDDRCLNVMPLFHIHALVAALLGSLRGGGSVVCAPPFEAPAVFDWIAETRPTWYTAVPTIHHAVLGAAKASPGQARRAGLRFIRSSSAALPPQLLAALEAEFGAPVIEAYGMTEAAHQIASNRLPPGIRKPGTVGVAAGPDVAILDADGTLLPAGATGEIGLRGPNVTAGYAGDPDATAAAFTADGWFRTGDEGVIDADGYLTITGRLKELINRGGEKIAPREIEEALLDHDGVAQAVAFALPHPTLGEDVGAAVVAGPGARLDPAELRRDAGRRLAPFKVPRRIVVLDAMPLGPTGKVQRVGLAERLGLGAAAGGGEVAAEGLEADLARLWCDILAIDGPLSPTDDFFDLGGNSLLAVQLVVELEARFGADVALAELASITTLGGLADRIRAGAHTRAGTGRAPVLLRSSVGAGPPLFLVPGRGGTALSLYRLAAATESDGPIYALEAVGVRPGESPLPTVEALAARHVSALLAVQPEGPFRLAGYSVGGLVAYEIARLLAGRGEEVDVLVMIDTVCPGPPSTAAARALRARSARQLRRAGSAARRMVGRRAGAAGRADGEASDAAGAGTRRLRPVIVAQRSAGWRYRPGRYAGPLTVLHTEAKRRSTGRADLGWAQLVSGPIGARPIPGTHVTAARDPHVTELGRVLAEVVAGAGTLSRSPSEELP